MTKRDWKRSISAWICGTLIGTPFGCIPAGGTEIPTFLSYATEKKLAKGEDSVEFGTTGAISVAGPEAANNATVTAALIPPSRRHSDQQHDSRAVGCIPELRHQPRPATVHQLRRTGLGADRIAVHRQHHHAAWC